MSTQQLDVVVPRRQLQNVEKVLAKKYRGLRRSYIRTVRQTLRYLRSQYYLTTALADSRTALKLNEDITLASLIIIAVLSFSTISIAANALYQFASVTYDMSAISGINLLLLLVISLTMFATLVAWLFGLLHNLLSISLMEGLTHKRNRSLRLTWQKSLHKAARTTAAWVALLLVAFGPVGVFLLLVGTLASLLHLKAITHPAVLVGLGIVGIGWIGWVVANYTLVPYVTLFEGPRDWFASFERSRQLVQRKGRVFIVSGYVTFLLCLAALYGLALLVQKVTHFSSTLVFLMLSTLAVSAGNAVLTVFYRKRKLARK